MSGCDGVFDTSLSQPNRGAPPVLLQTTQENQFGSLEQKLNTVGYWIRVCFWLSGVFLCYRTTKLMKTLHYSSQLRRREDLWGQTGRY